MRIALVFAQPRPPSNPELFDKVYSRGFRLRHDSTSIKLAEINSLPSDYSRRGHCLVAEKNEILDGSKLIRKPFRKVTGFLFIDHVRLAAAFSKLPDLRDS